MKNIFSLFYVFLIFLICSYTAFANPQEIIRGYLRQECKTKKQYEVANVLGVDPSYLSKFVKENSTSNAPKIVNNFQQKFPDLYLQLTSTPLQRVPQTLQVANPGLNQKLQREIRGVLPLGTAPLYDFSSQVNLVVADPNAGPITVSSANLVNPFVNAGIQQFQSLEPSFLPYLKTNQLYKRLATGQFIIENFGGLQTSFEIRLYGPDPEGRFGWITKENTPLECFAFAIPSKVGRIPLPVEYDKNPMEQRTSHDGSHGIDSVHAPFPGCFFNSNMDPSNFTPANPTLNQQIRKRVTQSIGNNAYREIAIYGNPPIYLSQRHKVRVGKWTRFEDALIPSAYILIGNHPSGQKTYFFPENNPGTTLSIYENVYKQGGQDATYKGDVIPQFEVRNAAHLFSPLIFDLNQSEEARKVEFYRIFYNAVNLSAFLSLSDSLALLKKTKLPFHWNGARGLTKDEIRRLVGNIHRRDFQNEPNNVPEEERTDYSPWNNFQLPTLGNGPNTKLTWTDASNNLIPLFPRLFNTTDIKRFRAYVTGTLFAEAAKSPLASSKMKLGIASKFIQEGEFEKAGELLELAFHQVLKEGTLKESIWLLELYNGYFLNSNNPKQLHQQSYMTSLYSLIERKSTNSTTEELLEIRKFNLKHQGKLPALNDKLASIRKITPENSRIIKKGKLFANKVWKLSNLFKEVTQLEEISLQDVVFSATDFRTIIAETDDDTIEDNVSSEEYFWEYEKPLFRVLKALEKHSTSLRTLNLKNVAFGFLAEDENKLSYWFDAANILKTLSTINLPNLEDLHITGILKPSDIEAVNCLENLQEHFPKLKKLYLSLDNQQDPYELIPEEFSKIARIFSGRTKDEEN